MLRQRLLSVALLLPVAAWAVYMGGLWFFAMVALAAGLAGYEFFEMMAAGGHKLSLPFGLALIFLFLLEARHPLELWGKFFLTAIIVGSLIWHLARPPLHPPTGGGTPPLSSPRMRGDRGGQTPALVWALNVAGGLFIGWLSARFISVGV
ncbi:MAG: phosphatidate cytidylyltransferase, partial [Anaerolineae bacterium]